LYRLKLRVNVVKEVRNRNSKLKGLSMKKGLPIILLVLLSGCASKSDMPAYEINNEKFISSSENKEKQFSYTVSVKPTGAVDLTPTKNMSRSAYKKLLLTESFTDSGALKLELEDKAANMLEKELKKRRYCPESHSIDEVVWRDYSVKLSGRCL